MSVKGIGLLGLGTVGSGVVNLVQERLGDLAEIRLVGVRDVTKKRSVHINHVTSDLESVVEHPDVDIVIEVMGGIEPAKSLILRALELGKPVITANKQLIATHWDELVPGHPNLRFEASVMAGVPVMQTIETLAKTNEITGVSGIINGTTNFMLSAMEERGLGFEEILREAQDLGYAEADPSADVDGFDAAYKLAIFIGMITGKAPAMSELHVSGIRSMTPEAIREAKSRGFRLKLIGSWTPGQVPVVGVQEVPLSNPLAGIMGTTNAVQFLGHASGPITLSGPGAGGSQTASGICGDLVQILNGL